MTAAYQPIVPPYGGTLTNLIVEPDQVQDLLAYAAGLPGILLSERSVCDLELLATGGFSPLDRFMGKADYERVVEEMRLRNGYLAPIPIALPIASSQMISLDSDVALRNSRNEVLAILTVEEIYPWNRRETAVKVFGTTDTAHPLVAEMEQWGEQNVTGALRVLQLPRYHDFKNLRHCPSEVRAKLATRGWENVVAFQTRNPLHRAHEELTKRAIAHVNGGLLLHPVVGMSKPGDIDHYTRVRTYQVLAEKYYEQDRILLSLLPLAMRMAGPREALWHALIRRNYGANHLIVGRDHASPGKDSTGKPFYDPYEAQELVDRYSAETGVAAIAFKEVAYFGDGYRETDQQGNHQTLTGTEVREEYLNKGRDLPEWFTRPEVSRLLRQAYPPRHQQGVCIWFTGLSSAGKSTTAEILTELLLEHGRQVTLLDGDVVRTHLSKGLGFTKEDRDTNVRRIGFVAAEIVRHGGTVICAAISPYRDVRNDVRKMVGDNNFIEVFVDTPLAVCEQRDSKGIYASARRGEMVNVTGIDDPYEPPLSPELSLDTCATTAEDNARLIFDYLLTEGLVRHEE
ncbi:MAG TPA: bifunctional sulfate adenylyltransferase/adenylylsulfate kinase [Pyrinomonadaceae bacterium]|nr:bifunctional sulfate adenylyltransferase/adenylylsulfate kinase [Pyrinomonadaceae bacterium]